MLAAFDSPSQWKHGQLVVGVGAGAGASASPYVYLAAGGSDIDGHLINSYREAHPARP